MNFLFYQVRLAEKINLISISIRQIKIQSFTILFIKTMRSLKLLLSTSKLFYPFIVFRWIFLMKPERFLMEPVLKIWIGDERYNVCYHYSEI